MVVRKSVFEKIGGFDENIFMYWEEPDLCWRIWKSKHKLVYLPMGKIWHAYGSIEKKVSKEHSAWITYQGCKNQLFVIYKNASGLRLFSMLLGAVFAWLALMIMFAVKLDFRKVKSVAGALAYTAVNPQLLHKSRKGNIKLFGKGFYLDDKWFKYVEQKRSIGWYLGKGIGYLTGKAF
jgi:GT2 family glycosyltransferase